jgi:excisionase family DNA binding protein
MVTRTAEQMVHGLDGPCAVLPGRACAALNRLLELDKVRIQIRGQDAQLDQALMAIKLAATAFAGSGTGTFVAPQPEPMARSGQQLKDTVGTTTAATILGMTDRAIRKAINEKRLPATKDDSGHHRISRNDLANYLATR